MYIPPQTVRPIYRNITTHSAYVLWLAYPIRKVLLDMTAPTLAFDGKIEHSDSLWIRRSCAVYLIAEIIATWGLPARCQDINDVVTGAERFIVVGCLMKWLGCMGQRE